MEPKSPSKSKLPTSLGFIRHIKSFKLTIAFVVILLLILIGTFYLIRNPRFKFRFNSRHTSCFTVVLDCGSSGTRVNVYEWMIMKPNSNWESSSSSSPILLHSFPDKLTRIEDQNQKNGCAYHCMQTEPGLDSFVGDAFGVKESLEPLIRRAEKWVPIERHRDTPIFVLATAGLRRLSEEIAMTVLDDIETVVKSHRFKYRRDWIRVLSGREEAYYGWIALNYHMGVLGNSSRLPTLGLLDLGGSSLQVATEIKDPTIDDHVAVFRSKIGSFEHRILAASLPAFGLNEAFDRTVLMLLRERGLESYEIRHPCLGYEFMQNYTCHGCFLDGNFRTQMRENEKISLRLVGEPNWEKCKGLARAVAMNSSSSSDWSKLSDDSNSNCTRLSSMGDRYIRKLVGGNHSVARFHALSGFFAVYNLLNLKGPANVSMIWEKGQELCSRSVTMPTNQKYADFLCFRVPYMVSLVENTLCVGDKDIVFGPGELSWTLGAAVIEGKDVWPSDRNIVLDLRFRRVILSPYFLFVLLAFLLFIVYRSQIKLPMPGRKAISLPSYIGSKRRPT